MKIKEPFGEILFESRAELFAALASGIIVEGLRILCGDEGEPVILAESIRIPTVSGTGDGSK